MTYNISKFKETLEKEQTTLLEELKDISIHDSETNEWTAVPEEMETEPDSNILADKNEDFDERTTMTKTLSTRLQDIEVALKKIEVGTFGVCEVCTQSIEEDRLAVNPSARTCKKHMGN